MRDAIEYGPAVMGSRGRRVLIIGSVAAVAVGLLAGAVLVRNGPGEGSVGDPRDYGPLSADQYAFAVKIAQADYKKKENRVSIATATTYSGTVRGPNMSGDCTSGRILEVDLVGSFPGAVMVGSTVRQPRLGTTVVYKADAQTGKACLVTLFIGGPLTRDRHAANLLPALRGS